MKKAINIFSIEGNIGSGKSTLLQIIKNKIPNIQIIKEPVDDWQKIQGIGKTFNLLEKYYQQPYRWAYTFQMNAIVTRMSLLHSTLQNISESKNNRVLFSERSITADKQIFANLLSIQGKMSQMEYHLYTKVFEQLEKLFKSPKVHNYIYLKTDPVKCLQRIAVRGRPSQKESISLQYLRRIHNLHQKWLIDNANDQICVLDGNQQFENNEQIINGFINQIVATIWKKQKEQVNLQF